MSEVLIAMVVLAIGVAGVSGAVVYGTRHADSGAFVTESTEVARSLFEEIQGGSLVDTLSPGEPWPGPDSGLVDGAEVRKQLNEAPFGALNFPGTYLESYRRRILVERLSPDSNSLEYEMARVTIEIFWSDPNGEHRTQFYGVVRHAR